MTITALVALLVCLIPTTIGGLLSAIGVAGMSRMMQANVIATSGRAVEAAGDVDVLLLDKTGTITLGNRQASAFMPAPGVSEEALADAAQLVLACRRNARRPQHRRAREAALQHSRARHARRCSAVFLAFTAQTRMSGVDLPNREIRKGASTRSSNMSKHNGGRYPLEVITAVDDVARRGSTPLVVAEKVNGVPGCSA